MISQDFPSMKMGEISTSITINSMDGLMNMDPTMEVMDNQPDQIGIVYNFGTPSDNVTNLMVP